MADPFQNVDGGGSEFVSAVVSALENRASEDLIEPVIQQYLDDLDWTDGSTHIEVGAGSGAIARRMAAQSSASRVIGIDPSEGLINKAKELATDIANLSFEVGDGESLRFENDSVDSIVMHTVLSHVPEPKVLLKEAIRVLKPGGKLVVSDADFIKSSLGNFDGDPLNACAEYFVRNFVTQPFLMSRVRDDAASVGFSILEFRIASRTITNADGGLVWIAMSTNQMVEKGLISENLAKALVDEYKRRRDSETLYAHQPFGTLVAVNPK